MTSYGTDKAYIGAGSGENLHWIKQIAFVEDGYLVPMSQGQMFIEEVYSFEQKYGADCVPCHYGMIIIFGYSRPGSWGGDTYYFIVNTSGESYNGYQIRNATNITWTRNLNSANVKYSNGVLDFYL